MKRVLSAVTALLCLVLAACGPEGDGGSVANSLPTVPADIQQCFRKSLPGMERGLNVGEVEALWKQDRIRYVVMRRCGVRFIAWYNDLQVNWR